MNEVHWEYKLIRAGYDEAEDQINEGVADGWEPYLMTGGAAPTKILNLPTFAVVVILLRRPRSPS